MKTKTLTQILLLVVLGLTQLGCLESKTQLASLFRLKGVSQPNAMSSYFNEKYRYRVSYNSNLAFNEASLEIQSFSNKDLLSGSDRLSTLQLKVLNLNVKSPKELSTYLTTTYPGETFMPFTNSQSQSGFANRNETQSEIHSHFFFLLGQGQVLEAVLDAYPEARGFDIVKPIIETATFVQIAVAPTIEETFAKAATVSATCSHPGQPVDFTGAAQFTVICPMAGYFIYSFDLSPAPVGALILVASHMGVSAQAQFSKTPSTTPSFTAIAVTGSSSLGQVKQGSSIPVNLSLLNLTPNTLPQGEFATVSVRLENYYLKNSTGWTAHTYTASHTFPLALPFAPEQLSDVVALSANCGAPTCTYLTPSGSKTNTPFNLVIPAGTYPGFYLVDFFIETQSVPFNFDPRFHFHSVIEVIP